MTGSIRHIFLIVFVMCHLDALAHEVRPAYLEINQVSTTDYALYWKIPKAGNKVPKLELALPDKFIATLKSETDAGNALIYKFTATCIEPINGQTLGVDGLSHTLIDVLVKLHLADNLEYTFLLQPDHPQIRIPIEPNRYQAFLLYLKLGVEHIFLGIDHLLFVLGLLLFVRNRKLLLWTITSFTLAHSITLALSTFNILQLNSGPVEAVIALSIIFLAREYLSYVKTGRSLTASYPWLVSFGFGLIHGLGFAGALSEIGLPQQSIGTALLSFNLGVELGQVLFIAVCLLLMGILLKLIPKYVHKYWKIGPYVLGTVACYWFVDRSLSLFL